jgi:hypothetical protein
MSESTVLKMISTIEVIAAVATIFALPSPWIRKGRTSEK